MSCLDIYLHSVTSRETCLSLFFFFFFCAEQSSVKLWSSCCSGHWASRKLGTLAFLGYTESSIFSPYVLVNVLNPNLTSAAVL